MPAAAVRHISHRRFLATFLLASVSRSEQDLYRCVSQAPRGAGVSNFAELIVKGQPAYARVGGWVLGLPPPRDGAGGGGAWPDRGAWPAERWGRQGVTGGGACVRGSFSPGRRSDRGGGV